jgi:hypothetical protein
MAERRDFLRKVAAAGTGAFALPMIVTVDPADAQALTSPPPESPGRPSPPDTAPTGSARPGEPAPSPGAGRANPVASRHRGRSELPRTGANLDRLTAAGLAATAGGAALVLWSADRRATATASPSTTKTTPPPSTTKTTAPPSTTKTTAPPSTTNTGTTPTGTTGTEPGT